MKTPITTTHPPDPLTPMVIQEEYYGLCPEFSTGYDPRDRGCVTCHLQLLCMAANRVRIYPSKVEAVKLELGVKYFLDEARTDMFEEFYADIVDGLVEVGADEARILKAVDANQSDCLQLEDPAFPRIVLARIKRDLTLEFREGRLCRRS